MSVAPPVPGHLHTLDLPTSGIDNEPLAPTAVSRERSAQDARRRSRWAIHANTTGTVCFKVMADAEGAEKGDFVTKETG